jgi:hypothetical protein
MNLTNDHYTILISGKAWTERYCRSQAGWLPAPPALNLQEKNKC